MNILLSPDSFKGTLTSSEVCDIIESALRNRIPDCNVIKLPAADGGEGLCSSFANFIDGEWISAESKDPFGLSLRAEYYMLKSGAAVIETASCAGLPLAGDRADPTVTTTAGVGMLIRDAVNRGAKRIVLGLGGSATNDCGAGMASELDFRFLDKNNNSFVPVGGTLIDVEHIIPPEKPVDIPVVAACDVTNPLLVLTVRHMSLLRKKARMSNRLNCSIEGFAIWLMFSKETSTSIRKIFLAQVPQAVSARARQLF